MKPIIAKCILIVKQQGVLSDDGQNLVVGPIDMGRNCVELQV